MFFFFNLRSNNESLGQEPWWRTWNFIWPPIHWTIMYSPMTYMPLHYLHVRLFLMRTRGPVL